jgi:hypothetical protein
MNKILSFLLLVISFSAASYAADTTNIPLARQVFHDRIKSEQERADKMDGRLDGVIKVSNLDEVNLEVTDAIIRKINVLRNDIENNEALPTNNDKIKYLRMVEDLVRSFTNSWKAHRLSPALAPVLVDNFTAILKTNIKGENMLPLISSVPYEVGVINAEIFKENPGYSESGKNLYLKYIIVHPDKILSTIDPYIDEPFADSLVVVAFTLSPTQIYTYAQDTESKKGKLINRNSDPRIKTIVELSKRRDALWFFPFLDDLISGKQTIESIAKYVGSDDKHYDSVGYYKLLVRTEIDYYNRLAHRDTPVAMLGENGLQFMLQRKAVEHFVTPINELHEAINPAVRFKAIEPLSSVDLYYMMVMGENDIFTSSYKNAFDRMMQRMGKKPKADSLLMLVNFDKFKKFIKMAAGYNRLDTFLQTMPRANSEALMKAFVSDLEKQPTLEDAVDVADSYGSITNKEILSSILKNVTLNEKRCIKNNSPRGQKIYSLLKAIFLSADTTKKIDLSALIGIPPVYTVDYNRLAGDTGMVVEQVFFYGDKDGKASYREFLTSFPANEWRITQNKEWIEIKSIKGKPVLIFANLPLDNETDKDADAQKALIDYLNSKNLNPTVVIHRGHSYHLPYTIEQLPGSAKIIMLGSCGGYKNLKQILDYAPEAHIISTKQTGAKDVNKPIIEALNTTFRLGQNVDWRKMWRGLDAYFAKQPRAQRDLYDDYIPPHKNLGAIFIKAYNTLEIK